MKITKNEKVTLRMMVNNPAVKNKEIATQLGLTVQAVGRLRRTLGEKGYIRGQELVLDYELLGIGLHVIALLKILPKAFRKYRHHELENLLQTESVIRAYTLPQTGVTHIIICAFRDVKEYDAYFRALQQELGEFIEIKDVYVFSSENIVKSSSKDLFLKILSDKTAP